MRNESLAPRRRVTVLVIANSVRGERWKQRLAAEGVACRVASDMAEGIEFLTEQSVDVIVVERPALETGGAALLAAVRAYPHLPVILPVEAGRRRPTPADSQRVVAAVQLARPARRANPSVLRVGKLMIDLAGKRVCIRRRWVRLPPTQYRLLLVLAQHRGEVMGYRELLKEVWGYSGDENEARELLKVHIRLIRRKLGLSPQTDQFIRSVRGFGYMLVDPAQE